MLFCVLISSSFVFTQAAITGEWDDVSRDSYQPKMGRPCSQEEEPTLSPGLNFYVDVFREKVYAFNFRGCEGDENAYGDVQTAEKNLPTDSAQCAGFNMTGWPEYGNTESEYKCPPGSSYLPYGEVSAICCDDTTAERYRKEQLKVCPGGDEPLTHVVTYLNSDEEVEKEETRRLIGRNCSHDFCPETHACWQGEFEAFCCPSPPPTEAATNQTVEESDVPETPAAFEAVAEDGSTPWLLMMGAVVFVAVMGAAFVWRRKSSRRFAFDEKEVAALNP